MKKRGFSLLAKKTASIVGAAIAAIMGGDVSANPTVANSTNNVPNANTIEVKTAFKAKPMPVLKFSANSLQNSRFVDGHTSHSSHSSHSSHASHSSHYSSHFTNG